MNKDFLNDLNAEQLLAANTLNGPLLCIAGAGTGKTKMLISRVANLLCEGVAPEHILLLTFTKKAATEMKERICAFDAIKTIPGSADITATTFHSFCNTVLCQYAYLLGYGDDFIIIDENDSMDILTMFYKQQKEEYPENAVMDHFPSRSTLMEVYSRSVSEMIPITESYNQANLAPEFKEDARMIFEHYDAYKKEHNMMDYDDLLKNTYILLSGNEKVRSTLDQKYRYIMCDEYQDTNLIQDRLLDLLSIDHPNLCVVGDDNQCWTPECLVRTANGEIKRVEELSVGEKVESFCNNSITYAPISNITRINNGVIMRVLTESGKFIRITANHKIFFWPRNEIYFGKRITIESFQDRYKVCLHDVAPEYFKTYKEAALYAEKISDRTGYPVIDKLSYSENRQLLETKEAISLMKGDFIPVRHGDELVLEEVILAEPDGFGPVYSIEVEQTGCLIANDILTHNSIYRFRSARIENILTFCERHNNCPQIALVRNYRSTQQILDFANAMMKHAKEGISKELVGFTQGKRVAIEMFLEDRTLASTTVDMIEKRILSDVDPKQLCVMGRNGRSTYFVEIELTRRGIPFRKYGGPSFFQIKAVRDVLSFLRACDSLDDEIAWVRMFTLLPGVATLKARNMYSDVKTCGLELFDTFRFEKEKSADKFNFIGKMFKEMKGQRPYTQICYVIDFYRQLMEEVIRNKKCEEDRKREELFKLKQDMQDLETLKELSGAYFSVRDMLADFALNMPDKDETAAKVNVTTVHSAKGLEYETVFLINPIQGVFPRDREDSEETREDLRCMYVAVTRPKKELFIYFARTVIIYGKQIEGEPSQFFGYRNVLNECDHPTWIADMFGDFKDE